MILKIARQSDIPFLRKMLYEAIFWRDSDNKPTFEEALTYSSVITALAAWGERDGDIAVIATIDSVQVGAAWYRYWTDEDNARGYFDNNVPVLAIGVHNHYRHQGIGGQMIEWLIKYASRHSIEKISLCVSKDNYAINLYKQQGFIEYEDIGDSLIMVRKVNK